MVSGIIDWGVIPAAPAMPIVSLPRRARFQEYGEVDEEMLQ